MHLSIARLIQKFDGVVEAEMLLKFDFSKIKGNFLLWLLKNNS